MLQQLELCNLPGKDGAAASISRFDDAAKAVSGLKMTVTCVTLGATSLSNWSHFPMIGAS
jgi:hypothetical protein